MNMLDNEHVQFSSAGRDLDSVASERAPGGMGSPTT